MEQIQELIIQEKSTDKDGPFSYFISRALRKHWEKFTLAYMKKVNRDRVIIVDGTEGVGKSLWTFQQAASIDPKMFASPETFTSRIAFSPEEFFNLVRTVKNGVVIFDEAFRGFSSRSALSKVNKKLVSALMEMRQNNNIVFIVLPSFFLLDVYPAMLRSNSLFNIYFDRGTGRRSWRGFNKRDKNKIYQQGVKKGWTYTINTVFKGHFYGKFPGGEEYRAAYEKKKSKALLDLDMDSTPGKTIYRKEATENEVKLIRAKYMELKSLRKTSEFCQGLGMDYSHEHIRKLLATLDERLGKGLEKAE